jgi:hypothetical protein
MVPRAMMRVPPAQNSQEYHRRRAEAEMERALAAAKPSIAKIHLDLARQHREIRDKLVRDGSVRFPRNSGRLFNGTDKEA